MIKFAAIPLLGLALLVAAALTRPEPEPPRVCEPQRAVETPRVPDSEEQAARQDAVRYLEEALARPDLSDEDRESCLRLIPVIQAEIQRGAP